MTLNDLVEAASPASISMLAIYNNNNPARIIAAISAIEKMKTRQDFYERRLHLDLIEDKVLLYRANLALPGRSQIDEEQVIFED